MAHRIKPRTVVQGFAFLQCFARFLAYALEQAQVVFLAYNGMQAGLNLTAA